MATLKKPYEISVWRDVPQDGGTFKEQKIAIIGSDIMTSQYRAAEPKLTRKTNGANEFSFVLYRTYKNSISGKQVTNPFVDLINNESKIKLNYDGEWYDFIIKNIQQDTSKHSITYTATDQWVNELSKNGYNLELADDLMNNSGTLQQLATSVLADTDWKIDENSQWPTQYLEETLLELSETKGETSQTIYAFYSSCRDGAKRFQFILGDGHSLGEPNAEGVYDKTTQLYIDYPVYGPTDNLGLALPVSGNYVSNAAGDTYDLGELTYNPDTVFTSMRANRIVYNHKSIYNPVLNKYVYYYSTEKNGGGKPIMGFTETEYVTPNIVENYVTNNTFKSTSGWRGAVISDAESPIAAENRIQKPTCTVDAVTVKGENVTTLIEDLKNQSYEDGAVYEPRLNITIPEGGEAENQNWGVANSGFYDCRATIENVKPYDKFVLMYRCDPRGVSNGNSPEFTVEVADYGYSSADDIYHTPSKNLILRFDSKSASPKTIEEDDANDVAYQYYYVIAEVDSEYNLTERQFKNSKFQIFVKASTNLAFYDFQIFRYVSDNNGGFITPLDQPVEAKVVTKYYYYDPTVNSQDPTAFGYVSARQDYKWWYESTDRPCEKLYPVYTDLRCHTVQISKSNYFNAIQELCEKFECWAKFTVPHNKTGNVVSDEKMVTFYTEVGKTNYGGFRYGVNLKSTKRTMDSKTFVSKLIVPDNVAEGAANGYCSIAEAKANPSGENYILNFSYYINQGMMDGTKLHEFLYRPKKDGDTDILQGYYHQLRAYNDTITKYSNLYSSLAAPLSQAEADYQTAEAGYIAATEKLEDAQTMFLLETGCAWNAITKEKTPALYALVFGDDNNKGDPKLMGYIKEITEYKTAAQKYVVEKSRTEAAYNFYKGLNDDYYAKIQSATIEKEKLTKDFYSRYSRFIQEGTWNDTTYIDSDTYYTDALATSYNSCQPQVSYTFDVVDLSALNGYEVLNFELGDMTWVEDPEIFGKSRESVVITELTYCLEAPDKNTIKVQNYRNQFADLFQKMTATTQTVQYSSAAWEHAGNFTGSNAIDQAAFLQDALESAELVLQNSGEQSVIWDKTGITVTDNDAPNKQIRIVGGAIMLRDEDGDGLGWKVGITSSGINAKLITAGQVDTGVIRIMNGNDNLFRWDKSGINAYYNAESNGYNSVNTKRGVRFDKNGIYGYDLTGSNYEPESWVPESINDINTNSVFSLTWDGLFINAATGKEYCIYDTEKNKFEFSTPQNSYNRKTVTALGKTDGYIYNTMEEGWASYDPSSQLPEFTKIMSVGGTRANDGTGRIYDDKFALYDNGVLVTKDIYISGNIHYAKDTSPSKTVYAQAKLEKPADGTQYNSFDENNTDAWHKNYSSNDHYYSHTDDAGGTWTEAILLTGKSIVSQEEEYYCGEAGLDPRAITEWSKDYISPVEGQCQYIRSTITYNDGSTTVGYSVGASGAAGKDGTPGEPGTDGASIGTITMYQTSVWQDYKTKPSAPVIPTTGAGDWTEDRVSIGLSTTANLLWAVPVTKMIVDGNISYQDWGTPYLSEAYLNDAVDTKSYAEFLTLTNFGADQGLSYDNDGQLYINANYINTGALIVSRKSGDPDDILFAAGWNNDGTPRLELGGFKVAPNGIALYTAATGEKIDAPVMYTNLSATSLQRYLLTDTSYVLAPNGVKAFGSTFENNLPVDDTDGENFSLILGKKFGVTTNGILYATGANISGTITAEDGTIGGWTLAGGVLKSNTCHIDSDKGGIHAPQATFDNLSIEGTLSVRNLSVSSDILKAGKITINGSISDSYLEFPNGMALTSIKGASASSASYSISYNDNETGNTLTITATTTATKHPEFSLKGSVIINYPGLVATTESIAYNYEIIIPINESKGQVTIYGMPGGSFGTITHPPTTVTYYTPSSASFLKINSENNSLSLYANGEYIYFGGSDEDKHPYIQTVARVNTVVNNMYGSWIVQGTMSGNITTSSDCRLKTDILSFDTAHSQFFDALKPVSFAYKSKPGTHFGFIAQDVLEGLRAANIDSSAIVGSYVEDDAEYLTLSYTDIIALNTSQIQQLKKRVAELEATVENLSRKFDIC